MARPQNKTQTLVNRKEMILQQYDHTTVKKTNFLQYDKIRIHLYQYSSVFVSSFGAPQGSPCAGKQQVDASLRGIFD